MIKKMKPQQLDEVLSVWYQGNLSGHPFIPSSYWTDVEDEVRKMLPQADITIYEEDGKIKGFIGIAENNYIAGLFVIPENQNSGIGKKLLHFAKEQTSSLTLSVFRENEKAVQFYIKNGFCITEEKMDTQTQEIEYEMVWNKR